MAERGKHRSEERVPDTADTTESCQEPIHHVAEENAQYRTGNTEAQQSDDATDQLAPPVAGYPETGVIRQRCISLFDAETGKYIIGTPSVTAKKERW